MSSSTTWSRADPFSKKTLCGSVEKDSMVVEGSVTAVKMHSVFVTGQAAKAGIRDQEDNLPTRFIVFVVAVDKAYPRMYLTDGRERNYDLDESNRKYVKPDFLSFDQLFDRIEPSFTSLGIEKKVPGHLEFFAAVDERAKQVSVGNRLRLFTIGSSLFVDSFKNLDGKIDLGASTRGNEELASNFVGQVSKFQEKKNPGEDLEGVDSDEWSDD